MNPFENVNIDSLGRSPSDQLLYEKFKNKVLLEYDTMEDYIKINYLNYKTATKPTVNKTMNKTNKIAKHTSASLDYRLVQNNYPYNIGNNIRHYVLFSARSLSEKEQLEIINDTLYVKNKHFIYFTNSYDKRSIKNLWHSHVLIQDVK